jgi:hypothetical protein
VRLRGVTAVYDFVYGKGRCDVRRGRRVSGCGWRVAATGGGGGNGGGVVGETTLVGYTLLNGGSG